MSTTAGITGGEHSPCVTASGARLRPIQPEAAAAFLARLGEREPESIELALGAHEDDGTLVGVAALGAVSRDHGSLIVAVVPERRRLQVGTDLLHALAADARRTGIRWFETSYPADAAAADALVRGCGLDTTRRVGAVTTTAVLDTTEAPRAPDPIEHLERR